MKLSTVRSNSSSVKDLSSSSSVASWIVGSVSTSKKKSSPCGPYLLGTFHLLAVARIRRTSQGSGKDHVLSPQRPSQTCRRFLVPFPLISSSSVQVPMSLSQSRLFGQCPQNQETDYRSTWRHIRRHHFEGPFHRKQGQKQVNRNFKITLTPRSRFTLTLFQTFQRFGFLHGPQHSCFFCFLQAFLFFTAWCKSL